MQMKSTLTTVLSHQQKFEKTGPAADAYKAGYPLTVKHRHQHQFEQYVCHETTCSASNLGQKPFNSGVDTESNAAAG
jgi:hypothetical protein